MNVASSAAKRTVLDILRLSTAYLASRDSGTSRLDAELLIADALGIQRLDLYLQFERPLAEGEVEQIRERVRRRGRGEPVAYILGRREFCGHTFCVSADVLIPRPDTETLVDAVVAEVERLGIRGPRIADLGTGSGCIACTLALAIPDSSVIAVDLSASALAIAAHNVEGLGLSSRVTLRPGAWAAPLSDDRVDVVVSNPPYVTTAELSLADVGVRDFEPSLALDGGPDGLRCYRELLAGIDRVMTPSGILALEVDVTRAAAVATLVQAALPSMATSIVEDLTGRPRVVVGRRRSG